MANVLIGTSLFFCAIAHTNEESKLTYRSGIRDWTVKTDFDYTPNVNHDIKFGTAYTYHTFTPDVTSLKYTDTGQTDQNIDTVAGSPKVYAHETATYIEDNVSIGRMLKANLGLHFFIVSRAEQQLFLVATEGRTAGITDRQFIIESGIRVYEPVYSHALQ